MKLIVALFFSLFSVCLMAQPGTKTAGFPFDIRLTDHESPWHSNQDKVLIAQSCQQEGAGCDKDNKCCAGLKCVPQGSYGSQCEK
ncbi:hypothetical protein J2802_004676 [Paraburkholderia caribensis]|nr:hypothetical protein [Paraburkholderia caribensis]